MMFMNNYWIHIGGSHDGKFFLPRVVRISYFRRTVQPNVVLAHWIDISHSDHRKFWYDLLMKQNNRNNVVSI
jgi:hypothetical protein